MSPNKIDANDDVAAIIEAFRTQLHDPVNSLSLLVRFEVAERDGEAVVAAFEQAKSRTLNERGCFVFELNRDPRGPGRFVVYERWRSLTDLEEHLRTDYVAELRSVFNRLILGEPEFQVLLPAA
jgi:quinol monooxygenase YgiN